MSHTRVNRRRVIQAAAVAAGGVLARPGGAKEERKGRIKQAVCSSIWRKFPFEPFLKQCKELGIVGLDFAPRKHWPLLKEHGLVVTMASGAGSIKNGLNNPSLHDKQLAQFKENIKAAADAGWRNVICMAGDRKGIRDEQGMENCRQILKEAVKIAADHDITICMELLNSKVNHPGYMCDYTAWGVELCKRVGSPHFKLLYDIYHMQIMEGDIIRTIRDNIEYIGHFHTAGNPGRQDLDEKQELYYPAIMRAIAKLQDEGKYDGYVAHEFSPKHKMASVKQAIDVCDV